MDSLTIEQIDIVKRLHMAKINISTIDLAVKNLILRKNQNILTVENIWNFVKSISLSSARLKANLAYGMKATFNTQDEIIEEDMFLFISDYCKTVLNKRKICVTVKQNASAVLKFSPQNIAAILENVISNSKKAKAKNIIFNLDENSEFYIIDILDDGNGIDKNKISNIDSLFEFGKGYTETGSGVGLFHIKEIIEKMNGNIRINEKNLKGFEINMEIKK